MPGNLPWRHTAAVVAASLLAVTSLTVSVVLSLRLQDQISSVQSATDLRRQLFMVGTALREAEAAQRMFIITGEAAHLAPLSGVKESLPERWRALREAARESPEFTGELAPLEADSAEVLRLLQATAESRLREGRDAALQGVQSGETHRRLVAIYMKLGALMEQTESRIEDQTRALALAESRGRAAALGTGLVALALGALGIWQWRRSLAHFRRELELSAEKLRAEQMAQDKSDFLAAMSHEVRTPLNAILGLSEQLAVTAGDDSVRQQAGAIGSAGRSMLSLVNDLLDLSRMEAGRLHLRPSAMPVAGALEWLRGLMQPLADGKRISFEVAASEDVPAVLWVDEGRFRQVIMNLSGNAVKFTPSGGQVRVKMECAENEAGRELIVEIKDTGCGIPRARQNLIFQPYVQGLRHGGEGTSAEGGVGLGLAIVRELVELMSGRISLQSQPGAGTTFRIMLPLRLPPESFPALAAAPVATLLPDAQPVTLAQPHAGRLTEIMATMYPVAADTQSTSAVRALADALKSLAGQSASAVLTAISLELHRASVSFAVNELHRLLEELPRRVAPLIPGPHPAVQPGNPELQTP